jgi:hypothetical protein
MLTIIKFFIITLHWDGANCIGSTKSKKLLMKINHVDEDEMRIQNVEETYLISYAQTNIGIMFEIGK